MTGGDDPVAGAGAASADEPEGLAPTPDDVGQTPDDVGQTPDDVGQTPDDVGQTWDEAEQLPLPGVPSGAGLRSLTRRARRGHGGAPWYRIFGDVYTYALSVAIGVALAVQGAGVLGVAVDTGATHGHAALVDPVWLVLVAVLALAGPALALLVRLGPVAVGAAGSLWWLPTPADRTTLLRPTAAGWLGLGVGAGALSGALLGLVGSREQLLWLTLDGAALGLVLVAATVLGQGAHASAIRLTARARAVARAGDAFPLAAILLWFALAVGRVGSPSLPEAPLTLPLVLLAGAAAVLALVRVGAVPGALLRTKGARIGEATTAALTLDMRALGRALTDSGGDSRRRSWAFGAVRGRTSALVTADALLLLRSPGRITSLLSATVLPVAVAAAGAPPLLAALALVVGGALTATGVNAGGRAGQFAPALDRVLGLSARGARGARLLLAGSVAALWALVVLGVLAVLLAGGLTTAWLLLALLLGPGLGAAGLLAAYRRPADWSKPLVVTPQGAYPPDLFSAVAMGPALALLAVLPTAVALATGPVFAVLVAQLVISGILVLVGTHVPRVPGPGESRWGSPALESAARP